MALTEEVGPVARLNFLDRFRPVGAPGAAGSTRQAEEVRGPAAELAPVFAALAPDVESAQALVAETEQAVETTLAAARTTASDMTAQARLDAVAERAVAATAVGKASAGKDEHLMARAHKKAEALKTGADAELSAVSKRVVERMVTNLLQSGKPMDTGGAES